MEHKEYCKKYYAKRTGYICYFCNVQCIKHGDHNKSLQHHLNMSKHLHIPIELTYKKKKIT